MKKILVSLLAIALLFAFTACNNESSAPSFDEFTINGKKVDAALLTDAGYTGGESEVTVSDDGKLLVGGDGEMSGIGVYFGTKETLTLSSVEYNSLTKVSAGDSYTMTIEYEKGTGSVSVGGNLMTADGAETPVMPSGEGVVSSALEEAGTITVKMTVAADSVSYTVGEESAKSISVTAGTDYRCGFTLWCNTDSSLDITSIAVVKDSAN